MALDNTEKINILFKKVFAGKAATNDSSNRQFFEEPVNGRLHVDSTDVWSEAHLIPSEGIDTVSASADDTGFSASLGVVTYYSSSQLGAVLGSPNAYTSSIRDWIPFNFGDGTSYNYVIEDANGKQIPQSNAAQWVFDTETGTLFFNETPDPNDFTVSPSNPPRISAHAYTGKKLNTGMHTGEITASGIISASKFIGDGSGLSNLTSAAITSFTNTTDNNIVTAVNATSIKGEPNLTFDGTSLDLTGRFEASSNAAFGDKILIGSNDSTLVPSASVHIRSTLEHIQSESYGLAILGDDNGQDMEVASLFMGVTQTTERGVFIAAQRQNTGNAHDMIFGTNDNAAKPREVMRLTEEGRLSIGHDNPQDDLHISGATTATLRLSTRSDVNFAGSRVKLSAGQVESGSHAPFYWLVAGNGSGSDSVNTAEDKHTRGHSTLGIQRRGLAPHGDDNTYFGNILNYRESGDGAFMSFLIPNHSGSTTTTTALKISSSGAIGIFKTSPNDTLDVAGSINATSFSLGLSNKISGAFSADVASLSDRIETLENTDFDDDLSIAANTGTSTINLDNQTLTIEGGNGLDTTAAGQKITIDLSANVGSNTTIGTFESLTIDTDLEIKQASSVAAQTSIYMKDEEMITFDGDVGADPLKVTINVENKNLDFKVGGSTDDRLLQTDAANNTIVFADDAGSKVGIGDFLGSTAGNSFGNEKFRVAGTSVFTNNITIQGNIIGDLASTITNLHNIKTNNLTVTSSATIGGTINANGNIQGDESSTLTKFLTVSGSNVNGSSGSFQHLDVNNISFFSGSLSVRDTASFGSVVNDAMIIHAGPVNSTIHAKDNEFIVKTNRATDEININPNDQTVMRFAASSNASSSNVVHHAVISGSSTTAAKRAVIGTSSFSRKTLTVHGDISSSGELFLGRQAFGDITGSNGVSSSIHFQTVNRTDSAKIYSYVTSSKSSLIMEMRDDSTDSIIIRTVGTSNNKTSNPISGAIDRVVDRGDVTIQGGSIINTIGGDSPQSFTIQHQRSSSLNVPDFTSSFMVSSSGNVGIGTTKPTKPLQVKGDISASGVLHLGSGGISASSELSLRAAGRKLINGTQGTITFNEGKNDTDVVMKSSGGAVPDSTFHLDAQRGKIGIQHVPVDDSAQFTITNTDDSFNDLSINGTQISTKTFSMNSSHSVVDTFLTSSFSTCKYLLQVRSGSHIQSSEMLVIANEDGVVNTEYAQINTGLNLVDFSTTGPKGSVAAAPATSTQAQLIGSSSFESCSIKIHRTLVRRL